MRITFRSALLLVIALLPSAKALQPPSLRKAVPFNYTRRVWQVQDGLPEDVVQAFAQTPDRYLWIGTTGGLIRFDGVQFEVYDRRTVPQLAEKSIFCMKIARDGGLWIGTEGGGLLLYRDGVFRSFSTTEGLTNGFVRVVYQDHRGQIWIGTDGGLFQVAGSRIQRMDNTKEIPSVEVHAIAEDAHEGLWVVGSRVLRIDHGKATGYSLRGELSQYRAKSVLAASDGTMWVGTVSGLYKRGALAYTAREFDKVSGISGTVRALWQSPEGVLWIGTIGQGAFVMNQGKLFHLASPGWLPNNTVLRLFQDAENDIWIGTQHGMLRLSETSVSTVPLPGAADSDFGTVYFDQSQDLWMASSSLFRIRDGVAKRYSFPGLEGIRIRTVFRDRAGDRWIGTDGSGAFRIHGNRVEHLTTKHGLVNNYIRDFLQSTDGNIWIATDSGVSRWFAGNIRSYQMQDGLCYFNVRSLLQDKRGDIWIGTERGLSRLRGDVFQHDEATQELHDEKVWSMHEDEDGALWFATNTDGLFRWKAGRMTHLTTAQGLVSDSIYQILEDPQHRFWISGSQGVSTIRRSELDRAAEHPEYQMSVNLFGISQGAEMTQIYGGTQSAGVLAPDGVWFPSSMGAVHISPETTRPRDLPPVMIDAVLVDGQERHPGTDVILKPGSRKVEFAYTAVSLRSPELMRFRYKLEGFDPNWTDSGSQRHVYYTNLSPGAYRFRVLAYNMNDPRDTSEASIAIRQKPYFYRTAWFLVCCLSLLAGLAWDSHQRHLKDLRLRFSAVLEERSRVAREMHDTLIQGCVGVSTLLEGIASLNDDDNKRKSSLLDFAREQLRLTLDETRSALWDLRRDAAQAEEIGPLLRSLADQIASETHVAISCHLSGKQFSIETSQARELLMVTREAVYNSAHHSGASRITVQIGFHKDCLKIEVSDDGRGFDPDADATSNNGHYGLIGMRERVEGMKGDFILKSAREIGTHVYVRIPCKPVFISKTGSEERT